MSETSSAKRVENAKVHILPYEERIAELEWEIKLIDDAEECVEWEAAVVEHRNALVAELARLRNEQPKGGDAVRPHEWIASTLGHGETMCKNCRVTNREAAVLGILNRCDAAAPSPAPPPEPQDVRGVLRFIANALDGWDGGDPAKYADCERPYEALQAEVSRFCGALANSARAALAQSDAQPVGWPELDNALRIANSDYERKRRVPIEAAKRRKDFEDYLHHYDERAQQTIRALLADIDNRREYTQVLIDAYAKRMSAPHSPDASGLIEAADYVKECSAVIQPGIVYTSMEMRRKLGAIEGELRSRAADRSAPRSDRGGG